MKIQISELIEKKIPGLCNKRSSNGYAASIPSDTKIITLGPQGFGLLQRATEWYARVGLGQLKMFGELVRGGRMNWFNPNEKNEQGSLMRCLNGIDFFCNAIRHDALGLCAGSSLSIHSLHLPPAVKHAWELQSAVRHRMAWDQTIEECRKGTVPGHLGVWHDDSSEPHAALLVLSQETEIGKRYMISLGAAHRQVAREALQSYARALNCDATVFHDLMKFGRIVRHDGEWVTGAGLYAALSQGIRIRELCQVVDTSADQSTVISENGKVNKVLRKSSRKVKKSLTPSRVEDNFLLGELARAFSESSEDSPSSDKKTINAEEMNNLWVFGEPTAETLAAQRSIRPGEHFDVDQSVEPWTKEVLKSLSTAFVAVEKGDGFRIFSRHQTSENMLAIAQSSSLQTAICKTQLEIFKSSRIEKMGSLSQQAAEF